MHRHQHITLHSHAHTHTCVVNDTTATTTGAPTKKSECSFKRTSNINGVKFRQQMKRYEFRVPHFEAS